MHVLFVHQNYPAQFGHIAAKLVEELGWRCTFVSQVPAGTAHGIERVQYRPHRGATVHNSYYTRTFENAVAHADGVYRALRARTDPKPDLVVGHSGFGSTLFLRELFDVPVINFFEYFYHPHGSDLDFRPEAPPSEAKQLRSRARNAMILLDLHNCDRGYTPTAFQKSLFPREYQGKIEQIFDGVDTCVFHRIPEPSRVVAGRTIDSDTRVVTYCARGFERMRGFDMFMEAARLIQKRLENVVFLVVGSDRICYGDEKEEKGHYNSFRERVLAEGSYDLSNFLFLGRIPPAGLAEVLSLSDVHIYLTAPFVLSWSLMSALACGAVVVASDTVPVIEVIEDGRTGLLASFFNPEQIADRAIAVLNDPPRFEPIRMAGMQLIREQYSLDVVLPKMVALYEQVCAS